MAVDFYSNLLSINFEFSSRANFASNRESFKAEGLGFECGAELVCKSIGLLGYSPQLEVFYLIEILYLS